VLALLGPNGAGKTTTIEILEGFRMRSAGDVIVLGADPAGAGEARSTQAEVRWSRRIEAGADPAQDAVARKFSVVAG